MPTFISFKSATTLALTSLLCVNATAINISAAPFNLDLTNPPLSMFIIDTSARMDSEIQLPTPDGYLWWDTTNKKSYNTDGSFISSGIHRSYLFPSINCTKASNTLCSTTGSGGLIPPTPQFAYTRSPTYNSIYYNTNISYSLWPQASFGTGTVIFPAPAPSNVFSHPSNTLGARDTYNLSNPQYITSNHSTFFFEIGMTIPAGAILRTGPSTWAPSAVVSPYVATVRTEAALPVYFPTFWHQESCTPNATTCVTGPNGQTLKFYEIKASTPAYPSGRTHAAELQNFANWFTYHRKRKLTLSANLGSAITTIALTAPFKSKLVTSAPATDSPLYDTSINPNTNHYRLFGSIINAFPMSPISQNPIRDTLNRAGALLTSDTSLITSSCQRNSAFIVTNSYDYPSVVTPPSYPSTYTSTPPYSTTHPGSLADIAASYYTNNPRPDLPTGQLAPSNSTLNPSDNNPNLHLNTYSLILENKGPTFPALTNPYTNPPTWTNPTSHTNITIDDIVHASINSRALYSFSPLSSSSTPFASLLLHSTQYLSTYSNLSVPSPNLDKNSYAYISSYSPSAWTGNLSAYSINPDTSAISTKLWDAASKLDSTPYTSRIIATFNGTSATPLDSSMFSIINPGNMVSSNSTTLLNWLRGDRSLETTIYAPRNSVLAPMGWRSQPATASDLLYTYATDSSGFLHAFSKSTGQEQWAYLPGFVAAAAANKANRAFSVVRRSILDSTPLITTLSDSSRFLFGSASPTASGYYAINISNELAATEQDLANKIAWEFPNSSTPTATRNLLGNTFGRPAFARSPTLGDVILLPNGYNAPSDTGVTLFVLNAKTGTLLKTIRASGSTSSSEAKGLHEVAALRNPDGTSQFAYGGDLYGALYRFDIDNGTASVIAELRDSSNRPQPITSAPELTYYLNKPIILVGTGRTLFPTDSQSTTQNSFYAFYDPTPYATPATVSRSNLTQLTLSSTSSSASLSSNPAYSWDPSSTSNRGWFFDLPSYQHITSNPRAAAGKITFNASLVPSPSNPCIRGSFSYSVSIANPPTTTLPDTLPIGTFIPGSSSGPTIVRDTTGSVKAITRREDGSTSTRSVGTAIGGNLKRISWRRTTY